LRDEAPSSGIPWRFRRAEWRKQGVPSWEPSMPGRLLGPRVIGCERKWQCLMRSRGTPYPSRLRPGSVSWVSYCARACRRRCWTRGRGCRVGCLGWRCLRRGSHLEMFRRGASACDYGRFVAGCAPPLCLTNIGR